MTKTISDIHPDVWKYNGVTPEYQVAWCNFCDWYEDFCIKYQIKPSLIIIDQMWSDGKRKSIKYWSWIKNKLINSQKYYQFELPIKKSQATTPDSL